MISDKPLPSEDRVLDEPLIDEDQAARNLKVKKQTMGAWRTRGVGPSYVRVGKLIKYRPSDLKAYVASRVVRPTNGSFQTAGEAAAGVVRRLS